MVFIYFVPLRPVQTEVVGDRYLDDFCLLILLIPNDNVWFDSPSFNIPLGENNLVIENGNVVK